MDKKDCIVLYMHAGSGNHGCEAIADSTCRMLDSNDAAEALHQKVPLIVSHNVDEDREYSLGKLERNGKCKLIQENDVSQTFFTHVVFYLYRRITGDLESFQRYRFLPLFRAIKKNFDLKASIKTAVSIGGDNYCYSEMVGDLILAHNIFLKNNFKTVLMGCSIEPASLDDDKLVDDLSHYERIIARESITFEALINKGFSKSKVRLCPDPAFALPAEKSDLPEGFVEGNTVGINLSPMAEEKETLQGITMENYRSLINMILQETDMKIAFIPHVIWKSNDDRMPLGKLYNEFKSTGRVVMISDMSAERIKFIISKCRFFIGARTHSTIAAYSSLVPTLVLGYSVKSRGIAKDLFGTYDGYVIPVQELDYKTELMDAFRWMISNENEIRATLKMIMPRYIEMAKGNIVW